MVLTGEPPGSVRICFDSRKEIRATGEDAKIGNQVVLEIRVLIRKEC